MKKIMRMLAFLGLFLLLLVTAGCEKDPNDGPVVYAPEITANYTIGGTTRGVAQSVTLNWDSKFADSCFLDGEYLSVLKGEKSVQVINQITVFTFTAKNAVGTKTVKVEVKKLALPVLYISASVTNLPKGGGKTKLTANAAHANLIVFNGIEYTNFPIEFETGWIDHDSTFTFIARGDGGEITKSITITVVPPNEQELIVANSRGWICDYAEGSYTIDGNRELVPPINGTMYFFLAPQIERYVYPCSSGVGTCTNEDSWSIDGQIITTGDSPKFIDLLTPDQMVWRYKTITTSGLDYYVWRHFVLSN